MGGCVSEGAAGSHEQVEYLELSSDASQGGKLWPGTTWWSSAYAPESCVPGKHTCRCEGGRDTASVLAFSGSRVQRGLVRDPIGVDK